MGKILIIIGIALIIAGVVISYMDKIPLLGKLPGDFVFERGNVKIYIPIASSILISILLSLLFFLISRFRN